MPRPRNRRRARLLRRLGLVRALHREELKAQGRERGRLWSVPEEDRCGVDLELLRGTVRPVPPAADRAISEIYPWTQQTPFVTELSRVLLVGEGALGIAPGRKIVADLLAPPAAGDVPITGSVRRILMKSGLGFFLGRLLRVPSPIRSRSVGLKVGLSLAKREPNYYHWTLEHLLKLRALETYERETGVRPVLILPKDPTPWMLEFLDLLGFGDRETIEWEGRRDVFRVRTLVVPSYPEPTPAGCRWLRERAMAGANAGPEQAERILVSRRLAGRRQILNEEELEAALAPWGFRTVALEELSVREQIRLFARARLVVAPHGAGLTNMVFSRGASFVELFGKQVRPQYYRLSLLTGQPYRYVLCEPRSAGMVVDCNEVVEAVEALGATPR